MDQNRTELLALAQSQSNRLRQFSTYLERHPDAAPPETIALITSVVQSLEHQLAPILTELESPNVYRNASAFHLCASQLRVLQSLIASALVSLDWQSPSYLHAIHSEAGTQTGKIEGTINDYKRDHHLDADSYEKAFLAAYVDRSTPIPVHAYATVSGMAAFATIVNALQMQGALPGPIVMGQSCYFENKKVLQRLYPDCIVEVDEMDTDGIVACVREIRPSVIFLDSLCNTETLAMPDLATLLPRLASVVSNDTFLVLDNSGLGPTCQPLKLMPILPGRLKLIVFESLNKHHQFGMDRVTGGMIWTQGFFSNGLFGARMHLGTNMPDASVLAMPEPNRALLDARLAHIFANANAIARALEAHLHNHPNSPVASIAYPGVGASLVLRFKPDQSAVRLSKIFIANAIKEARRANVNLSAGTSFGLNTTRVYLTALHATHVTTPFLRISAGTESDPERAKLIDVFKRAADSLVFRQLI